jgi:bis(5'-nucleosyl)-tetraphosphatase (symmetrical)
MVPGMSIDEQEPWAMYNIRALIEFNDHDEITQSEEFLNTIEERLTDMYPGEDPSQSELKEAQQSAIGKYEKVGYLPTDEFKDGKWWVESWNEVQRAKPESERLTLVYGHDSKRDLQVEDYSFGLDSGCVNGGKMTALVLQPRKADDGEVVTLEHSLVSVSCTNKS